MNNSTNTQQTTFWNFLKQHKIEIPIIQRDYAQGRLGKEKLRETFLGDLKNALDDKLNNEEKKLKLDFVYGSIENKHLNPLDGQQRLTTLWLLHWFIAHKAGKLNDHKEIFKNFSYETRVSSREFCSKLSEFTSCSSDKIVEHIQKQTWFLSVWKQDPTIQSMLYMLGGTSMKDKDENEIIDGIEEIFEGCEDSLYVRYWEKLQSNSCPIIFYYLDLFGIGLSDDLYIKMNARGKPLTNFENFKADLVGYIKENDLDKSDNPKNSIAHKLDTTWTDLFWKYRSPEQGIDEIYFAFINRFMLNYLITATEIGTDNYLYTQENIEQNRLFRYIYDGQYHEYGGFEIYQEENYLNSLIARFEIMMDNFCAFFGSTAEEERNRLFSPPWQSNSDFRFIPEYLGEKNNDGHYKITTLTQSQRVSFYAICCYFDGGEYEEISFRRWMRVVWNIVENGNITTVQAMIGAIRLVQELSYFSRNLYGTLANSSISIKSDFAKEQMEEEKEKARIIIREDKFTEEEEKENWEERIIEAEKYAFFKGCIRFLYRADDDKEVEWNLFDIRFKKANEYFDENGVKDTPEMKYRTDALLLRTFVSRVENPWDYLWYNKEVFDNKSYTWKILLTNSGLRQVMNIILSGNLSIVDISTVNWHKKIYETTLLSYVATNMEASRVRDIHGHKAIYPARYPGIILDMDKRDNILSELMNDNLIEIDHWQIVAGMSFFRGWDINFKWNKYEDYKFQWNSDRNIYLLNNRNERIMIDEQYLFFPESEINKDMYIVEFENLIHKII
ncbi:DUF262 domain-containing protein [Parabacteroides sp. 52]|uniref:DUF262 domain-containing protein n=1 Tax=unclassified Parabacteroides TaxID=2649774 RepID=UPI0013D2C491|nr:MULTISPECIES: DUF262 domain-containing protein [unclassified Parabacteroides]MDH6534182.1 hypothetical protein [Parabacteroides sp. PM5-20]NDV55434.1 DUF262 domain-containing protein [Parabacteroides sp. 52]